MPDGTIRIGKSLIEDEARFTAKVESDPEMVGAVRLPNLADDDNVDDRWYECLRADKNGKISVDMPLARAQRLEEIRVERNRRLAALDGPWMRATGQGKTAEAAAIEAKRQHLRDIPNELAVERIATWNAITAPDELAAYEPDWPE
ncbi:MAG: hypothetical protein IID61_17095 [SAR324 cluster bacterium]|nr:hypothetical protein [SAR324 cluster bacterium]